MKTILYLITQSELGGAQCYIFDLAKSLVSDFEISVAFGPLRHSHSEASEQGADGYLTEKLNKLGVKYYTIKHLKRDISPLNDFLAIFEIIKLIKKIKPDIVHLNSSKISILGSLAAAYLKLISHIKNSTFDIRHSTFVYTVHGWVFNEPLSPAKKLFYKYAEKFTAYFKDKIICISKLDYEIAKSQLKIPEKKLTLIHHGIKPINFLSREEAIKILNSKLNPEYSGQNSKLIIGTIANLYKTKGLEYLIEAIKILATYNLQLTTIIIGAGEERKNLENLIKKYNLEKNIFLLGSIKNAAEYLKAFDIYVSSSVKEGFPYSILEAMQVGLPIVATNVGGIPEMITDGKNGLLVEPKNPKESAEKIKILIENENIKNILGAQAQKDAKEKFGIEKMIEKTKEVYLK
jgi:glycosyltransferase involved in cell wall biosynthesis